jgi:hypothetical protein
MTINFDDLVVITILHFWAQEEDGADPSVVITFEESNVMHNCLALPGMALLVQHWQVPRLVRGGTPAASRVNFMQWIDAAVMAYSPNHQSPENINTGLRRPGHYGGLRAYEYTNFITFISTSSQWTYELDNDSTTSVSSLLMRKF